MKCVKTKPCSDCPFRKKSLAGWIGNWEKPDDLLHQSESELGLPCHKSYDNEKHTLESAMEFAHVCVGSLQSANNSCKVYRSVDLSRFAKMVGKSDLVLKAWEFVEHHSRSLLKY